MITVNLFDENFRHDLGYSVAGRTPKHVRWVRDQYKWDGITVFTDAYVLRDDIVRAVDCEFKIGWLHEPQCLWPHNYEGALDVASNYDKILTYYDHLLEQLGFEFVPYGGVWVPDDQWGMRDKSCMVSMLFGDKMSTEGHKIRRRIALAIGDMDVDFYGYYGVPVDYGADTKLRVLRDYRFSVVGETCRQNGLFTEILLDCFALGTVPIFWGCPNIDEFFDERGVLAFETPEEAAQIVEALTPALYEKMRLYAKRNLEMVSEYACTEDWLWMNVFSSMEDAA